MSCLVLSKRSRQQSLSTASMAPCLRFTQIGSAWLNEKKELAERPSNLQKKQFAIDSHVLHKWFDQKNTTELISFIMYEIIEN